MTSAILGQLNEGGYVPVSPLSFCDRNNRIQSVRLTFGI